MIGWEGEGGGDKSLPLPHMKPAYLDHTYHYSCLCLDGGEGGRASVMVITI